MRSIRSAMILVVLGASVCLAQITPVDDTPKEISTTARIAPEGEPGTPLVISGTVYAQDGVTPVAGIIVYGYHTDKDGYYTPAHSFQQVPRLRGWAKTDANGHFEFRTIRPAPYPNRSIPAHVHWKVWGAGYPLQGPEELQFSDDPFVTDALRRQSAARGRFANIVMITRDSAGVQHCAVNLQVEHEPTNQ